MIATLLNFLRDRYNHRIEIDRTEEGGRQLAEYFNEVLSERMFPYRTKIGPPTEIRMQITSRENADVLPLSMLEVSGEEYLQLTYNGEQALASYIERYFHRSSNIIFLLVIEANHEKESDELTGQFINYVIHNCRTHFNFIVLFSKIDLFKEAIHPKNHLTKHMPQTLKALLASNVRYQVGTYSIGSVDGHNSYKLSKRSPGRLWQKYLSLTGKHVG